MKIPAIMGLVIINRYVEEDNDFVTRNEAEKKEINYESLKNILDKLLSNPLAMGSWDDLIQKLINAKEYFELDGQLVNILERTKKTISKKISKGSKGTYESIVNWRNEAIGHGVTSIKKEIYWQPLYDLVTVVNDYFRGDKNEVLLSDLYENISFKKDDLDKYVLEIRGEVYDASHFVKAFEDNLYYFDAYFSGKHLVKISDFIETTQNCKNDKYFEDLVERLKILSESFEKNNRSRSRSKEKVVMTEVGEATLSCLKNIDNVQEPDFIINKLNNAMDDLERGVILLQMERGTGKSTLAHQLDGRYLKTILQKNLNAIVRVYHVGDMNFISATSKSNSSMDFYKGMPNFFENHPINGDISRFNDEDKEVHPKSLVALKCNIEEGIEARKSIVELLSLYRDIYTDLDENSAELSNEYDSNRIVLIIDGIDELGTDTKDILDRIPKQSDFDDNEYANNVFIVLTSRKEDENDLSEVSIENIEKAKNLLGSEKALISIADDNQEYHELLVKYISKLDDSLGKEEIEKTIEIAKNKFLYIRPYMVFGDLIFNNDDCEPKIVAKRYIDNLMKLYFGISQNSLYLTLGAITLFGQIAIRELSNFIFYTDVTYDVIGCLNDLMPLLTVKRGDGESVYEFANSEYRSYILENYPKVIEECITRFQDYIMPWFEWLEEETRKNSSGMSVQFDTLDKYVSTLAVQAEKFDRINDGNNVDINSLKLYADTSHRMMNVILEYIQLMIENRMETKFVQTYIDFFNYISAYGRANEKIKNRVDKLKDSILNYCKTCTQISKWCDVFFVSGDTFSLSRRKIIIARGVSNDLIDYFVTLSKRVKFQHGFDIHIYVHNLYTALECCNDEKLIKRIHQELKILLNKDWTCPKYYKNQLDKIREENNKFFN